MIRDRANDGEAGDYPNHRLAAIHDVNGWYGPDELALLGGG
ncbi:MAG TPA: hypothetical protein VLM76_03600 [Patescibacteria group bacterium]|nr:hypothetical protein [Patescibacteria group bacterium]